MTFKELVSTISNENDIPAGTVRKVAKAVAESIKASVESGDELKLPGLKFKTVVKPAREATESKNARAEKKTTIVKLPAKKNDTDD